MLDPTLPTLPPHTHLLGLGHKARNGKDTLGRFLQEILSPRYNVQCYAFARALYDDCRVNLGMGVKDALLLQRRGVERREADPLIWVRTTLWRIHDDAPDLAIITDTRFRNEADTIRQYGGLVGRVIRRQPDGSQYLDPSRPSDHPSECDVDAYPFDFTVEANSLGALYREALGVAQRVTRMGAR